MSWVADLFETGIFLWTSWGVVGLLAAIVGGLVIFNMVTSTLNSTKRFESLFLQHKDRIDRQDEELRVIRNSLEREVEARIKAEKCNSEYRHKLSSYAIIIGSMLTALRMMQSTRRLTNSIELDKEIDLLLLNIQTELKRHDLMKTEDNLLHKGESSYSKER